LGPGAAESVSATLIGGSGTVTGSAQTIDGTPLGGVPVSVTGDGFRAETTTLTTNGAAGSAGSFTVTGLPVPNDYTISFDSAAHQVETLGASFTTAGTNSVGAVTLLPITGTVTG